MNRPFYTGPAKPAFGSFHSDNSCASDYILNKKNKILLCNTDLCRDNLKFKSESGYTLARSVLSSSTSTTDKSDLNINLVTKLNLKNICVIQNNKTKTCPTTIDLCTIPYIAYTIDPTGALFGNTYCGANNYLNYLEYNTPDISKTNGNSI